MPRLRSLDLCFWIGTREPHTEPFEVCRLEGAEQRCRLLFRRARYFGLYTPNP